MTLRGKTSENGEVPVYQATVDLSNPGLFLYVNFDITGYRFGKIKPNTVGYWNIRTVKDNSSPAILGSVVATTIPIGVYFPISQIINGWYLINSEKMWWLSGMAVEEVIFYMK